MTFRPLRYTALCLLASGALATALTGCNRATEEPAVQPENQVTTMQVQDLVAGSGPEAVAGSRVTVHYTGWLTTGEKFDSSVDRNEPFQFVLGEGQVIAGWDQGVATMRVGDKVKLTIPSDLAYGDQGYPGAIPPKATLVFEVELLAVG